MRSILLAVALVSFAACSPADHAAQNNAVPAASASSIAGAPTVFPSATAVEAAPKESVADALRSAPISSLRIVSWSKPGVFAATIDRPDHQGSASVTLTMALDQNPIGYRRRYAYALLARELGLSVVPTTVLRRVSTGELGAFFANDADVSAYMAAHASVQNDGTIAALVTAPSRGDAPRAWQTSSWREVPLGEAPEARAWAKWAASTEPAPDENAQQVRDYVETLALDYLSANIMRRSLMLNDATGDVMVADSDGAFPPKLEPGSEERLLERLRPVLRFPRGLRDALMQLTRKRMREVFTAGAFDEWLLSPRALMLVDERRVSLITLIEARIVLSGTDAVLSL